MRDAWISFRLWVGAHLLTAYAVAGSVVGLEVFAFLAVWPLAIGVLLVGVAASVTAARRARALAR